VGAQSLNQKALEEHNSGAKFRHVHYHLKQKFFYLFTFASYENNC
jgi:hypothetical protein